MNSIDSSPARVDVARAYRPVRREKLPLAGDIAMVQPDCGAAATKAPMAENALRTTAFGASN